MALGIKVCPTWVAVLNASGVARENWLQSPQIGEWPSELPCKCLISRKVKNCPKCSAEVVCSSLGRAGRGRRVLLIARGITHLARRCDVSGDKECAWLLRATHISDGVRHPGEARKSVFGPRFP